MPNRLAGESSPYLLQHADNPVDWYPWGQEALDRAKAEDKPVFISIGYAACHWCHVMAHESFEDPEIAALMNELFINVKIDREERPDVDAIYMNAIQIMGQGGGWPLSAWCTPTGEPYYLGTYFPPTDRHGRAGFPRLLTALANVYKDEREKVLENTENIMDGLRQIDAHYRRTAVGATADDLDQKMLIAAGRELAEAADPKHGGFGSRPKFPSSSAHDVLARTSRLDFGEPARKAFLDQCQAMARGGIYDHVGGGFSRYSVDERWLVPHFEKMLYDNAQLLAIYGDAHTLDPDPDFLRVIDETVIWLRREMQHESGALYASQDADSEGQEGKYYVWTPEQVTAVLGPADAIQLNAAYGVVAGGNFEDTGATVLSRITPRGSDAAEAALTDMRRRLFESRDERVHPETDTKVLAGWNGLAVSGLLRAWGATGHADSRALALEVGEFLASSMLHDEGTRLRRVFKDGDTKLDGTLDDYSLVARAFFDLAEATGDAVWWARGEALVASFMDRYYEETDGVGVFYMTPSGDDDLLIHRPESHHDGAMPAGAAVAIECLLRLAFVKADEKARDVAERYLAGRAPQAVKNPFAGSRLLAALDEYLSSAQLVVSAGEGADELLQAARQVYAPTLRIAGSWADASLLDGKVADADGRAQAYVCQGNTCSAPVTESAALRTLLEQASPS